MKTLTLSCLFAVTVLFASCKGSSDGEFISDEGLEFTQQVGDFMTSIDEFGGGNGNTIASTVNSMERDIRRYFPREVEPSLLSQLLLPEVWAATCSSVDFSGCSAGKRTKSFGGCTVGSLTISGSVELQWNPTTGCAMSAQNQYVSRKPSLTATTGRTGITLAIIAANEGQRITRGALASQHLISSDGVTRRLTDTTSGTVVMDFTSSVTSAITLTGTTRTDRVLNGGTLSVVNNKSSSACNYVPSQVAWTSTACSCPTSGVWTGSCSDGNTSSIQLTGCGTANVEFNGVTASVRFDRCGG